jgi:D-serine deaminase-like pyridoxal phosphate-dependent protein
VITVRLDELDTPALWVDLDVMEANLDRMARYASAHGLALRPHIKTHKIPELARLQLGRGAIGVTSAKVTEAQVMVEAGVEDILLAYPIWGEKKWERLRDLSRRTRITVATDSRAHALAMADALGPEKTRISLFVEVDLGGGRTGLAPDEHLETHLLGIARAGIPIRGLMFYRFHVADPAGGGMARLGESLAGALEAFHRAGVPLDTVSGGSTPLAFHSHLLPGLTEIRPGTYIFNDCNTVDFGGATWEDCALRVRCRVVSTSVKGTAVIDGGSKTFSDAPRFSGTGFGRLVQAPEVPCARMNEEHGLLDVSGAGSRLRPGDLVDVIPNHVCTTVNLHRELFGVRNGLVETVWSIAAQGKIH